MFLQLPSKSLSGGKSNAGSVAVATGRGADASGGVSMNFEKYTERTRGFVQAAQRWRFAKATSSSLRITF